MTRVSPELRTLVTDRARGLCEYCQTAQINVVEMEVDHIQPESKGGLTISENLCLACVSCNRHKRDRVEAIDPIIQQSVLLFNPRLDIWKDHFRWSDDGTMVIGLTPTGRATVVALRVNRDLMIRIRQRWVSAGWHPPD